MLDSIVSYDILVLNFFRSLVDPTSAWQVKLVHIGADMEVGIVMLLLVGLWLYGAYKKNNALKKESLMILYSIAFAFLVYIVLNQGLPFRPRPETVSSIKPIIDHFPDNSFPSGHGIFAGASVLAAFLYSRRTIAYLLLVTGIIMILCRVIAGIHYPLDVTVGFLIGLLGSYVVYLARNKKFMTERLLVYPVKIAAFLKL